MSVIGVLNKNVKQSRSVWSKPTEHGGHIILNRVLKKDLLDKMIIFS